MTHLRIAIDHKDTIRFDLGAYSNSLTEYDRPILYSNFLFSFHLPETDMADAIFVKNRMQVDYDTYRKNNVTWDTIDGHEAKIIYPRQTGTGTTGIYINSLWIRRSDVERFSLYGTDLEPANERQVLALLQTIRFRKR